jgi:hypothetical protein
MPNIFREQLVVRALSATALNALVGAFSRITDVDIRRNFVGLIEKVATLIDNRPQKPKRSKPRKKPK